MSCTIDHLRVDHHVTVLRDFADLSGVVVRAGERGVLRGLGADFAKQEIWIELERGSARDTLRFALRAGSGPRNGGMREFFEMGDPVESPPPAAARTIANSSDTPQSRGLDLTAFSWQPDGCQQPPNDTCIEERTVACDCEPAFHRALLSGRSDLSLHACLRCGTVTCARSFGDDGRFTGDAWQMYRTVAVSPHSLAWLARLPRIRADHAAGNVRWPMGAEFVRYPTLYYPADTRCADLAELTALESRLSHTQSAQSDAERLRATHRVTGPPPDDLPEELRGYFGLWEALQLRFDSELPRLIALAQLDSLGSGIATEMLRRRADAFDVVVSLLHSDDRDTRGAGFAMARDMRPADPRLVGVLIEMLGLLSCEPLPHAPERVVSWSRFEMIFLLIAELKLATPEMLATLRALMRKLARHDATLVDRVRIVIRELDPPPPE